VNGRPVWFRFHGELNDFLPSLQRNIEFAHTAGATDTVKHVVESLGVPHTEVGRIAIGGEAVLFTRQIAAGDRIEVFPHVQPILLNDPRFVLDGHLGRLAAYLRMLGFDTWYERSADDALLASVSSSEGRLLLTRDVGLLKRREIENGYCVRSHKPHDQLREITSRFALYDRFTPFQRCMDCNGDLHPVAKAEVTDLLPPHTRETKDEFSRCAECSKIFWRGSHHARMLGWIADLTAPAIKDTAR
jgi:uncharacterized protein